MPMDQLSLGPIPTGRPLSEAGFQHPLDPLSAEEIGRAAAIIRQHFGWGDALRVETIDLDEPTKDAVRSYSPGAPIPRIARFNVYRVGVMGVWQGRVDLATGEILTPAFREDARAMVALEEVLLIEKTVKEDARFQEALRHRGLLNELDLMCIDPWTVGDFGHAIEKGRRVLNCFIWMRTFPLDNYYAHPVEGLHALIDLSTLEVLEIVDHFGKSGDYIPVPRAPRNYDAELLTQFRAPSAPLDIVQPAGPGFRVEGNRVTWENWDFRVGFTGREGLVLYTIGYTHDGKRRPVLYRASIAEMVVPYGTPERSHYRKNVFDSGEIGFGRMANSLKLGCDCLGAIHYFDAIVPDVFGGARTIENCICLHEEDAGLSWKHLDVRNGRVDVRRARRLVISSISTIGNYEYASYWYLHQDGRIEYEMKATGIINTAGCHPGQPGKFGAEVAPGIVGHIHQHIFCARLDLEVDGPNNTVVECDTIVPPAGPENPLRANAVFGRVRASAAAANRWLRDERPGADALGRRRSAFAGVEQRHHHRARRRRRRGGYGHLFRRHVAAQRPEGHPDRRFDQRRQQRRRDLAAHGHHGADRERRRLDDRRRRCRNACRGNVDGRAAIEAHRRRSVQRLEGEIRRLRHGQRAQRSRGVHGPRQGERVDGVSQRHLGGDRPRGQRRRLPENAPLHRLRELGRRDDKPDKIPAMRG